MSRLVYTAIASLDGYVADAEGKWDWSVPSDEVHAFVNDIERAAGTMLYGRRMYEVLRAWETLGVEPDEPAVIRDFGELWRAADKVVYSSTLPSVNTGRTRLERTFDADAVRALKASTDRPLSIGGPTLAATALRAGLVDEIHLLLSPVVVGGGTPALPSDLRLDLSLLDTRRFANGVVHVHYSVLS
jgi:dihydrofolate reductase